MKWRKLYQKKTKLSNKREKNGNLLVFHLFSHLLKHFGWVCGCTRLLIHLLLRRFLCLNHMTIIHGNLTQWKSLSILVFFFGEIDGSGCVSVRYGAKEYMERRAIKNLTAIFLFKEAESERIKGMFTWHMCLNDIIDFFFAIKDDNLQIIWWEKRGKLAKNGWNRSNFTHRYTQQKWDFWQRKLMKSQIF